MGIRASYSVALAVVVVIGLSEFAGANTETEKKTPNPRGGVTGAEKMPMGLWEAFAEARHAVEPAQGDTATGYRAQSPANDLVFDFGASGLTVRSGAAGRDWSLGMSLAAWGQKGSMTTPGEAEVVTEGRRIEYRRGGLTEWYVNRNRGLEQGFTLERPDSYDEAQPVVFALAIEGGLVPSLVDYGRGASFTTAAGRHAFHYKALKAFDAGGADLPAYLAVVGNRLEVRVDVGGGAWPVTVDPVISTETKLQGVADDAEASDNFGYSVAISNDTAVIGASREDQVAANAGAAYVFTLDGGFWIPEAKLTASDGEAHDNFGTSVAIHDDEIVVGAPYDDGFGTSQGSAYVFLLFEGTWTQEVKLTASPETDFAYFGRSVSIWGDLVVGGAEGYDDEKGAAFVFLRESEYMWYQDATLESWAWPAIADDRLGASVSVSGTTVVVGVPGDDDDGESSGSAIVYEKVSEMWGIGQKISASDPVAGDEFGESVSLDGDDLVIGAPKKDDSGADSGAAYVFHRSGEDFTQVAKLLNPDGAANDRFGFSVAFSDDVALVGAYGNDDAGPGSGSAHVFRKPLIGTWIQEAKLTASDAASGDDFGWSVAISGNIALVGANGDDDAGSESGSAYVFTWSGSSWGEDAKLVATLGTKTDGAFGGAVAIDGDLAIIGEPYGDGGVMGSGAAWVFERTSSGWELDAKIWADDGAFGDRFGGAVALEDDSAFVGAPYADDPVFLGTAGAVYVFERHSGTWSQQSKLTKESMVDLRLGESVAVSEDVLVVGGTGDYLSNVDCGLVVVYRKEAGGWEIEQTVYCPDAQDDLIFGHSVAVEDTTILVGAPGFDSGQLLMDSGAVYVLEFWNDNWINMRIDAPVAEQYGYFGRSVAILGDTAVIGAENDNGIEVNSGAAYVYSRSGGTWEFRQELRAEPEVETGLFGLSVSASDGGFLIGEYLGDGLVPESGSAHLFVPAGMAWILSEELAASDGVAYAYFGVSTAISGDTAVIGASAPTSSVSPSAYVYDFPCGFGGGLEAGRWKMIGLPCDPGAADTVEDVFGDNLDPADYGTEWIVYKRDEVNDIYTPLGLASSLVQGTGYWIYNEDWAVWDVTGSATDWTTSGLCVSPKGCFEEPLASPASAGTHRWNLVGHPGNTTTNWSGVAVLVDGTRFAPYEAEAAGYVSKTIHTWTGAAYDAFDDVTPGMEGMLKAHDGFWVDVLGPSWDKSVSLLIADGMTTGAPPAPPGRSVSIPAGSTGWYTRLIAGSVEEGLVDRGNVLGQLPESSDGYDDHDLIELDPFADPHLTIVFPHPDWGEEAGDYTSDYHPTAAGLDDEWVFEVRTDDPNRDVRLAWEHVQPLVCVEPEPGESCQWVESDTGSEQLTNVMWMQDLATGELIKASTDGELTDYVFNMNGENVRVFRWYAELMAVGRLFADGFENGGTGAWSEVEP